MRLLSEGFTQKQPALNSTWDYIRERELFAADFRGGGRVCLLLELYGICKEITTVGHDHESGMLKQNVFDYTSKLVQGYPTRCEVSCPRWP